MSWYTVIYDAIGTTPDPGLIEAKVQRVHMLASSMALKGDFQLYMSSACLPIPSAGRVQLTVTPVHEHRLNSRQVYSTSTSPHLVCIALPWYLLHTSTEQSPGRAWTWAQAWGLACRDRLAQPPSTMIAGAPRVSACRQQQEGLWRSGMWRVSLEH